MKLHRIHAEPSSKGNSLDIGGTTGSRWRGEGGKHADKQEIAKRLAVCWNVCEGLSTEQLMAGHLKNQLEASLDIAEKILKLDYAKNKSAIVALKRAEFESLVALAKRVFELDGQVDRENGRLHDCKSCAPFCEER